MTFTPRLVVAGVAGAVVLATVVGGLVLLGSPGERRAGRFDQRRLEDLRGLAAAVDLHFTRSGALPESLRELPPDLGPAPAARDPETGEAYGYERLGVESYRLCATFNRESRPEPGAPQRDFWAHGAGRHCFELEAERIER
jgi:hypothetical protein